MSYENENENEYQQEVHMVLDTETTGVKVENGDRIVEIGIVEMINNQPTGRKLHKYVKPVDENGKQRVVGDSEAIHGLSDEFLSKQPLMADVLDEVLEFIKGTTLVIHNAPFDVKFLEKEMELLEKPKLFTLIKNVHCTLKTDRMLYEGSKHKLDDICDRFGIDRSNRTVHGALLDAELLAECFRITNLEYDSTKVEEVIEQTKWVRPEIKRFDAPSLQISTLSENEQLEHDALMKKMEEKNKKPPVFSLGNNVRVKP